MTEESDKTVFEAFTKDDILSLDEHGQRLWRGKPLSVEQLEALKEQALILSESVLWKILKAELQWFAQKTLIEKGENGTDIRMARAFGNIVQVIEAKLKDIGK